MTRRLPYTAIIYTLPFLIEGVFGLDVRGLQGGLEARQTVSPTTDLGPVPSLTPIIVLNDPSPLVACTPANVSWLYAGPPFPISIVATDAGVPQDTPPPSVDPIPRPSPTFTDVGVGNVFAVPSGASQAGAVTRIVTGSINPFQSSVPWSVNVPQGWYHLVASARPNLQIESPAFFVREGPDTACLGTSPPPTSPTSSSPSPDPSSISTSPPSPTLGGNNIPDPSSTSTSSTSNRFDTGAIVGVVVGAIALIIIVLLIYFCLRRRKDSMGKPVGGHLGGAKLARGWGGLGSVDSKHGRTRSMSSHGHKAAAAAMRNPKHYSASESLGPIFSDVDQRSGHSTPFSPSEEKLSTSPAPHNPFDDPEGGLVLATLPPNGGGRPNSARSSLQHGQLSPPPHRTENESSSTLNTFATPHLTSGSPPNTSGEILSGAGGRRLSLDSTGYPPTSPPSTYQYYPSSSAMATDLGRSHSTSSSTGGAPPSSSASRKQVHRQSGGTPSVAAAAAARKTPRKPVPVYDTSNSLPSTISTSNSTPISSSPSPYTPTGGSPVPTYPIHNPNFGSSSSSSAGQGHYGKKLPGLANNPNATGSTGELAHKNSFGPGGIEGKPMHYLIPDMPLAKND